MPETLRYSPSLAALAFAALLLAGCQTTSPTTISQPAGAGNAAPANNSNAIVTTTAATPKPAATPGAPVVNKDFQVEPGFRIGKIELNMERPKVHTALGRPLNTYSIGDVTFDLWGSPKSDNYVEVAFRGNKAVQIEASSPKFATADKGMTTKSTLAELQKAYKLNKQKHTDSDTESGEPQITYYYNDNTAGVSFLSLDDKKCHSVIVHKPGSEIITPQGQ